MSRYSLPRRTLIAIREHLTRGECIGACGCVDAIDRALAPTKASKFRTKRRTEKRAAKREKGAKTSAVYRLVAARAGLVCECGCGRWFRGLSGAAHLDHFEGRARSESLETCWLIRSDCHARKHAGDPSRAFWLGRFADHCDKHGYATAAAATRDALFAAQAKQQLYANLGRALARMEYP